MPWTFDRFPASMKHLKPVVREKAILIANALLEDGYAEDQCIRIALARAREWAECRALTSPAHSHLTAAPHS